MNEPVKIGIIDLLSLSITSIILLFLAEYDLALIFYPDLLAFIIVCAIAAVIINRRLSGSWGNTLAVFIAVMAVGFFWSVIFNRDIANSPLFVVMAMPSSVLSLLLWKIFIKESGTAKHANRHLDILKNISGYKYKRKK